MTEPCAALAVVLLGVALLAHMAPLEVVLEVVDEGVALPAMHTTSRAPLRFGAHPSECAGAVIDRPCQELGEGDSSPCCVVDGLTVEKVPILVPALVKGMSTSSLLAVTAAAIRIVVSESDHSRHIR